MNVGRSFRRLPHCDNNLVQALRNVSRRVKAGNCCLRMAVDLQCAHVISFCAKRHCQAGPVSDAERRVHHVEPVLSLTFRGPRSHRAAIQPSVWMGSQITEIPCCFATSSS